MVPQPMKRNDTLQPIVLKVALKYQQSINQSMFIDIILKLYTKEKCVLDTYKILHGHGYKSSQFKLYICSRAYVQGQYVYCF